MRELMARFWAKVDRSTGPDGCWLWMACLNSQGYGQIRINHRSVLAHRVSYEAAHGPIQDGQQVLHRCDTPRCVNPAHLFLGTPATNSDDKVRKGRQAKGEALPIAKLSPAAVAAIRASTGYQRDIAARFGVAQSQVSRIKAGKRWRHVPDLLDAEQEPAA